MDRISCRSVPAGAEGGVELRNVLEDLPGEGVSGEGCLYHGEEAGGIADEDGVIDIADDDNFGVGIVLDDWHFDWVRSEVCGECEGDGFCR